MAGSQRSHMLMLAAAMCLASAGCVQLRPQTTPRTAVAVVPAGHAVTLSADRADAGLRVELNDLTGNRLLGIVDAARRELHIPARPTTYRVELAGFVRLDRGEGALARSQWLPSDLIADAQRPAANRQFAVETERQPAGSGKPRIDRLIVRVAISPPDAAELAAGR